MLTLRQLANLVNYYLDANEANDPDTPVYVHTDDGEIHDLLSLSHSGADGHWALCASNEVRES